MGRWAVFGSGKGGKADSGTPQRSYPVGHMAPTVGRVPAPSAAHTRPMEAQPKTVSVSGVDIRKAALMAAATHSGPTLTAQQVIDRARAFEDYLYKGAGR